MSFQPPPIRTPLYTPAGAMAPVWVQWLQNLYANLGSAAGVIPVASGGTGLEVGISGGVLGFTSPTVLASSALLAANALVLGGGAGATPTTPLGLGTTVQVLHGNAAGAPTWGSVALTADVSGTLPIGNGGTGLTSYATGDLIYASAANALSRLADVATGNAIISGGVGVAPSWGKVGLTTHISGTLTEGNGGTNQSTYTLGDILYSSSANTLSKLAGNTTGTKKFLRQTGTGAVSAAPAWDTIVAADVPGSALTKTDDTNVTLTLGGSPTTALLNAASITVGWTGQLGLTRGGTAASLTASNGGIVYSTASAFAILSGTATAGQVLRSGASTTPAWSTATYPATAGTAANVLRSDGTNFLSAALAAADLSNGVTGSGSVVLATSPTIQTGFTVSRSGQIIVDFTKTNTSQTWRLQTDILATDDFGLRDATGAATGWVVSTGGATVKFPSIGTTASAANAFLDSGASNSLIRSTSSLRYKPFVRPLELVEAQKMVLDGVPIAYMHESGKEGVGLAAEWEARDPRMVTFDQWGRPDWVQYPHYVAPLMLVAQDHERRLRAAGL